MGKKSNFGVNLYHKQKPRKRPGRHKKNRNKQNPIAQELSDGRYHQRVVKNKKVYDRKKFKNQLTEMTVQCLET